MNKHQQIKSLLPFNFHNQVSFQVQNWFVCLIFIYLFCVPDSDLTFKEFGIYLYFPTDYWNSMKYTNGENTIKYNITKQ